MAMKPRPAMPIRKPGMGQSPVAGKPTTKPIYGKPVAQKPAAPKPVSTFKPVVNGASKNIGERFGFQQNSNGNRYQQVPVNKAKGLTGGAVTSTAGQRAALPNRSRINALQKKLAGK